MQVEQLAAADSRALGTNVRIVVTRAGSLAAAQAALDATLREIDLACSRFRDDSELSRLNARSGEETIVSPLLAQALAHALRGARITGGDVDPTVGTALRLLGYDTDFAALPADRPAVVLTYAPVPGWRTVRLNSVSRSVCTARGVEIDLGATAKAFAADLGAAAALAATGGRGGVLVSLGGDIAVAGEPPRGGWVVQVSDDSGAPFDATAERITIRGGAIATSSTRVRRWQRGGVELHHIVDPRTGTPADGSWRLATVVADSCVDANIAATAAIVRGAAAVAWLEGARLPARLVGIDEAVVRLGGWPVALS